MDDAYGEITEQKATSFLLWPLHKCANSHLDQQEEAMHISRQQGFFKIIFVAENEKYKAIKEKNTALV